MSKNIELDDELIAKIGNAVFDMVKTKFFKTDGTPAKDIEEHREDLIHESEVYESFNNVVGAKEDKKITVKNIEKANEPTKKTPAIDKYGLTEEQRAWLLGYIFCVEGGYFNHPNDPGGETMYGIIKSRAREYGYTGPMKDLPKEVAADIYLKKYWAVNNLHLISDFKKALCIFDLVVHSGSRGIRIAQEVVNRIALVKGKNKLSKSRYAEVKPIVVDGKLGPESANMINKIEFHDFIGIYFFLQEDLYEDLMNKNTKLRSFDTGWENRIATKVLFLNDMERLGY